MFLTSNLRWTEWLLGSRSVVKSARRAEDVQIAHDLGLAGPLSLDVEGGSKLMERLSALTLVTRRDAPTEKE